MKSVIAAIFGGILALNATAALAEIACNAEGDCWHVKDSHFFRPEHGVIIHPDSWKWAERDKYRWREHEGRGYWHGGRWVEIR